MHRLVSSFPESRLSPNGRRLRQEYLSQALRILPPPRSVTVAAWHADYDESDPRIVMFDPDRHVLRGQPTMKMAVYPFKFKDGSEIADVYEWDVLGKRLFQLLEQFVEGVYDRVE